MDDEVGDANSVLGRRLVLLGDETGRIKLGSDGFDFPQGRTLTVAEPEGRRVYKARCFEKGAIVARVRRADGYCGIVR